MRKGARHALHDLEPGLLWAHFDRIRQVPRPSKHERRVRELVGRWAKGREFPLRADAYGNLVVDVPATPGREQAPVIVLQAHLDMVCEKSPGTSFDFLGEPIQVEVAGDWVTASRTTLGADDGIGVAAAMAVAEDPEAVHGPLQLLLTVEEELGLRGALRLDSSLLRGRLLLNLDSEDSAFYIGSAGAGETLGHFLTRRIPLSSRGRTGQVRVWGLSGGHSGLSILEHRANSLKQLASVLYAARTGGIAFALIDLAGGSSRNALPREAYATLQVDPAHAGKLCQLAHEAEFAFRREFADSEGDLRIEWTESQADPSQGAFDVGDADRVIDALLACPHGVHAMNREIRGLVETSSNLATVATTQGEVLVTNLARSSSRLGLDAICMQTAAVLRLAGAEVEMRGGYPGWQPRLDSPLLRTAGAVYERLFGHKPQLKAVHAGLECGVIGTKVPGMDMISFGPTIEGAHTPRERVHIGSVGDFYRLLKGIVAELAHPPPEGTRQPDRRSPI
jgi:dipeptidase D